MVVSLLWYVPLIVWALLASPSVAVVCAVIGANMLGYWEGRYRPEVRWSRR